ncbi:HlyD family secretion protein [Sulfoacidibacillus thermotolerans]|uniref:RND efflux pump membrane fusion protein barrel-sandwich domain-containing protein n=1 Tax=Sulfoacidibacillus thermotolerans TaxID=1765684 RepID=A0A2U3DBI8_SULT2|nr:efflux RND transporter periplasmic adaptor subunit [Sulfoacidibacillus thermotolerans]PWI58649.1 hypothetical protein BM613_00685 [Sulfoacidibacillus thermotolerans]
MKKTRIIGLTIIGILAVLVILIGGGWYAYQQMNYVKTADASIQGTVVPLTSPGDGTLQNWNLAVGDTVSKDAVIGKVNGLTGTVDIHAPISGTVVQDNAVNNEVVVPGEPLGYIVNMNNLQIVANVQETEINNVKVGKSVDITINAYPNTSFSGTVTQIGGSSTVVAQGVPNTSLSGAFNKQTQRVPVYISISGSEGKTLMPGMSAQVSIHQN